MSLEFHVLKNVFMDKCNIFMSLEFHVLKNVFMDKCNIFISLKGSYCDEKVLFIHSAEKDFKT